jgi:radical SAM/Cys-rich protein
VQFNRLFCLANMPLGRYKAYLVKSDNYADYCEQLVRTFNPANLSQVMCRETLSVDWTGRLFDCDFNQSLDLNVNGASEGGIRQFDADRLNTREIVVGEHCFGCTAGAGSSCQGCFD